MAHDEDFRRLALLSDMDESKMIVKDLTLSDIMRMPLKHGSRPPLLVDVLRSAMTIGEHAKLVIEIKPGNSGIVEPLMALFDRHPALLSRVAVIMSFDAYILQDVADRFAEQMIFGKAFDKLGVLDEVGKLNGGTIDGRRTARKTTRHRSTRMTRARPVQTVSYAIDHSKTDLYFPKILVLTAFKDHHDDKDYVLTSVKNGFEGLDKNLPAGGGIDGVYLEYEEAMLTPEGKEKMLCLAEKYAVGVWMLKPRDSDALSVAKELVEECGVSFVNTDFHREFFTS
ncbi:hypothetical protein ACHAWF_005330 [Thalassiosira exigua]